MSSVLTESKISSNGRSFVNTIKAMVLTPIKYGAIDTMQEVPTFFNFMTSTQIEIPEGGIDLGDFVPAPQFITQSQFKKEDGVISTSNWLDFAGAIAHYEANKKK